MMYLIDDKIKDFQNTWNYVQELQCIYSNPTFDSLRKLYYDGFSKKIAYMMTHYPMFYKTVDEQNMINEISKLIDNAKNSCKWKILDDLKIKEA